MDNTIIKQASKDNDFQDDTNICSKILISTKERISLKVLILVSVYVFILCLQASKVFAVNFRALVSVVEIGLSLYISYSTGYFGMILCTVGNSMAAYTLFMTSMEIASYLKQNSTQLTGELIAITDSTVGLFISLAVTRVVIVIACIIIAHASTKGKKNIKRLELLANIDGVTGAFNHRYFQTRLIEEVERANDTNSSLGMIMIDLDNFKMYNDKYGHKAGDLLLCKTSHIFMEVTREQDIVCRYGGDEFAILMPDANVESMSVVVELIRVAFGEMIDQEEFCDPSIKVTLSIGYSIFPELAKNKDDLILQSDIALYQAKKLGRNNPQLYNESFAEHKDQYLKMTGMF